MPKYVVAAAGQLVRITAVALAHRFEVEGTGLTGTFRLDDGMLAEARLELSLSSLTAHDRLKDHELRRFLDIPKNGRAEAVLVEPAALSATSSGLQGQARFRFSIGPRVSEAVVALSGAVHAARGTFQLRFTQLGYKPPRLLLLSVKDELSIEVSVRAEESGPASV